MADGRADVEATLDAELPVATGEGVCDRNCPVLSAGRAEAPDCARRVPPCGGLGPLREVRASWIMTGGMLAGRDVGSRPTAVHRDATSAGAILMLLGQLTADWSGIVGRHHWSGCLEVAAMNTSPHDGRPAVATVEVLNGVSGTQLGCELTRQPFALRIEVDFGHWTGES